MARFTDLHEQDRIQYIKDEFIRILELLARDPSKIKSYLPVPKTKKVIDKSIVSGTVVPVAIKNESEPLTSEEKNEALGALMNGKTEDLDEAFAKQKDEAKKLAEEILKEETRLFEEENKKYEDTVKKIEAVVSAIQKKEGCLCGTCININITSTPVQPELEALIDAARKTAEEKSY